MDTKIVKICGLKSVDVAQTAVDVGSNLLGVIVVPGRARTVDPEVAIKISQLCQQRRQKLHREYQSSIELLRKANECELEGAAWFENCCRLIVENGPFFVGVFRNQPLQEVIDTSHKLGLDFVQLHGSEDVDEYVTHIELPVIPRFVLQRDNIGLAVKTHRHILPLLDSERGGEGKLINWKDAERFYSEMDGRFLLAGGLTPENVALALKVKGCVGVDVSGGVETEGKKDKGKVERFLKNARTT
ncbi:DEKNAAC104324 [Brettanomyces naardenensis]|uniref:N-(5'-phosphoribosyl)anthranilate isomerase n=1 Tax=Brettanomyces naardenensis TaxID=13370 RepID=A0A448YQJ3_BRENA|nr:DEKNAAC104324 [Brettanomyces naardenensis]